MSEDIAKSHIDAMFKAGAHFGYSKARRHPSIKRFIFGAKNNTEIIDLEKTDEALAQAKAYATNLAMKGKQIWFVGTKPEAKSAIEEGAQKVNQPYVSERWIGGLLTNFPQMKKRLSRLNELVEQKEKGELSVYTKKEQLLIDREIEQLRKDFGGIAQVTRLPDALFIIDPRKEHIAVSEAEELNIPMVALASSDCDIARIDYPIPANDATVPSIEYFVNEIVQAIRTGQENPEVPKEKKEEVKEEKTDKS